MRYLMMAAAASAALGGCAQLKFGDAYDASAVTFYDPLPVVVVTTDKDCKQTVAFQAVPGRLRTVKPQAGWDSSKLSITLENGMLKSFNQDNDGAAKALQSLAGTLTSLGIAGYDATGQRAPCPSVVIRPWNGGALGEGVTLTPPADPNSPS